MLLFVISAGLVLVCLLNLQFVANDADVVDRVNDLPHLLLSRVLLVDLGFEVTL